jgi:hypothetical protein
LNSGGNATSQVGNGQYWNSSRPAGNRRRGANAKAEAPAILDPAQSATVRENLVAEVAKITSSELAAQWAKGAIAAKNKLTAEDAKVVEETFEKRMSELPPADGPTQRIDSAAQGQTDPTECVGYRARARFDRASAP